MHRTINLLLALVILLSCALPANAQTGKAVVQDLVTLFSGWSGDDDDHSIY